MFKETGIQLISQDVEDSNLCGFYHKWYLFYSILVLKLMLGSVEYTQFPKAVNVRKEEKGFVKNSVPYFYVQNYWTRIHSVKVQ